MLKSDVLSQLKQLKTEIKASRNLAKGIVKGTGQKFGFVTLEDTGKDVYLPPDEMQRVLPGDRVEVEIKKDAKNKSFAALERLISANTRMFCGKYVTKGSAHFIEPDLPGMSRWIFVPPNKRKKAQARDFVYCQMTQHPFKSSKAQAAVVEVLGSENDDGLEWKYAKRKNNIRQDWPKEAQAELDALNQSSVDDLVSKREDFTDIPFVTIDSKSTTDMDDAVWAEKADEGWRLLVAVADPSALIAADSEIEKELIARATSVYFPAENVAMLPPHISSDLCSLVEGQKRLAKIIAIDVKSNGELGDYSIKLGAIKSYRKLSYPDVAAFIDSGEQRDGIDETVANTLTHLSAAAKALADWRGKHSLTFADRNEFFFDLDENRQILGIRQKVASSSHRLIEECMVAANRVVADFLRQSQLPSIFMSHEGVRKDRIEGILRHIATVMPGEEVNLESLENYSQHVRTFKAHQDPNVQYLHTLISRQLEKGLMSLQAKPHFGMGLPCYTTFTSPLRKANDFLLHRQVTAILEDSEKVEINPQQIEKLEEAWQKARAAVFDVEQWLKCRFIQKSKETFKASVLRVFNTGFQVRLLDNGIEGFINTKEMEGKISYHQDSMRLNGKNLEICLDQEVNVTLKHIDWSRKQIQFDLVNEGAVEDA